MSSDSEEYVCEPDCIIGNFPEDSFLPFDAYLTPSSVVLMPSEEALPIPEICKGMSHTYAEFHACASLCKSREFSFSSYTFGTLSTSPTQIKIKVDDVVKIFPLASENLRSEILFFLRELVPIILAVPGETKIHVPRGCILLRPN